jgi:hypothetical protein
MDFGSKKSKNIFEKFFLNFEPDRFLKRHMLAFNSERGKCNMNGLWKGVLSLVMMVVFLTATGTVYAGQTDLKAPPPEQSKAHKEIGIESLQYLQDWNCSLIPSGGGKINLTGYTRAYQTVDYIMVKLYLQRWNGSSWVDLSTACLIMGPPNPQSRIPIIIM